MRTLNKKQKKIIDEWFNKNWTGAGSICSTDDMPFMLLNKLEDINDTEILYQEIDRYITDKALEKMYG